MYNERAERLCSIFPDAGWHCLRFRRNLAELAHWLDVAVSAALRLHELPRVAAHLAKRGSIEREHGNPERSIAYGKEALQVLAQSKTVDRLGTGRILGNIGAAYLDAGQTSAATEYYSRALATAREIIETPRTSVEQGNAMRSEVVALLGLGTAVAASGRLEDSIEYFERSRQVAATIGDLRGRQWALLNLGIALRRTGKRLRSIDLLTQAAETARSLGDASAEELIALHLRVARQDESKERSS